LDSTKQVCLRHINEVIALTQHVSSRKSIPAFVSFPI